MLNKTMQVTPKVMRMLGGILQKKETRDDPRSAAAITTLTVSEKSE